MFQKLKEKIRKWLLEILQLDIDALKNEINESNTTLRFATNNCNDATRQLKISTQKPVLLIEELIKTYTNPNDLVLDSCAGSCTTAIAAINTKRNYICFEKDSSIFQIGCNRVENYMYKYQMKEGKEE